MQSLGFCPSSRRSVPLSAISNILFPTDSICLGRRHHPSRSQSQPRIPAHCWSCRIHLRRSKAHPGPRLPRHKRRSCTYRIPPCSSSSSNLVSRPLPCKPYPEPAPSISVASSSQSSSPNPPPPSTFPTQHGQTITKSSQMSISPSPPTHTSPQRRKASTVKVCSTP